MSPKIGSVIIPYNVILLCYVNFVIKPIVDSSIKNNLGKENKVFPNFKQKLYNVGSVEQFIEETGLDGDSIPSTFHYLFSFLKKGIYLSFVNVVDEFSLKTITVIDRYVPFNNANYRNEWFDLLKFPEKDYIKYINNNEKKKFGLIINKDLSEWYANNCIFRNTIYSSGPLKGLVDEGDKSIEEFLILFKNFCYYMSINPCSVFINPRDFPVLRSDHKHPYTAIYRNHNKKMNFVIDLPILSQVSSDEHEDIPIPTEDDINNEVVNRYKRPKCKWSLKKDIAIFRGSATGCAMDEHNPRLKISAISKDYPALIDAGITSLNKRLKVDPNDGVCRYIDPEYLIDGKYTIKTLLKERMSDDEQVLYKYVIDIPGHVCAFRLSRVLSWSSVVLKVPSKYYLWFESDNFYDIFGCKLNGIYYEDIVSMDVLDSVQYIKLRSLSDGVVDVSYLVKCVEWCRKNDDYCRVIGRNGYIFYMKYLRYNGIMNYLRSVFVGFI